MPDVVRLEIDGGIAVITLDRFEVRNAVNAAVAAGVAAAVDEIEARSDVFVTVLTGAGGTFCSGMDLKAFVAGEAASIPGRGSAGFTAKPPRTPTIAAVEGAAVAGGCELVLACDMVVAAVNARFGVPEVKRGLVAVGGALLRLPQRIPYQLAMELIFTGEFMDAPRAPLSDWSITSVRRGARSPRLFALRSELPPTVPLPSGRARRSCSGPRSGPPRKPTTRSWPSRVSRSNRRMRGKAPARSPRSARRSGGGCDACRFRQTWRRAGPWPGFGCWSSAGSARPVCGNDAGRPWRRCRTHRPGRAGWPSGTNRNRRSVIIISSTRPAWSWCGGWQLAATPLSRVSAGSRRAPGRRARATVGGQPRGFRPDDRVGPGRAAGVGTRT